MFNNKFGIEIEFSGITRSKAATVAAEYLGGRADSNNWVTASDGRVWKFVSDGSVNPRRKVNGRVIDASNEYKVELVSPILTYREDIDALQELVRRLRKAGAFAGSGSGCGIHYRKYSVIKRNGAKPD